VAADNEDYYVDTDTGQLHLTLAQSLLLLQPVTILRGFHNRVLVQILQMLLNFPAYQDVQDYQGDDWEYDVEDSVHPQDVDVEVPLVNPDVPGYQLQVSILALSKRVLRFRCTGVWFDQLCLYVIREVAGKSRSVVQI